MGVYIPGVEMPTEGNETIIRILPDGTVLDQYGHHLGLKALPVPEHGRLMDKDAFIDGCEALSSNDPHDIAGMEIIKFFMEEIVPTPTIIPADLVKEEER